MTFVQSSKPSAVSRPDEGAALQRRLMQDLERQWLDNWTVADQLQAQAAPTPEEQPQTDSHDLTKSLPLDQTGNSVGPQSARATTQPARLNAAETSRSDSSARMNAALMAGHEMAAVRAPEGKVAAPSGSPRPMEGAVPAGLAGSRGEVGAATAGSDLAAYQQVAGAALVQMANGFLPQSPVAGAAEAVADSDDRIAAMQTATASAPTGAKSPTLGLMPGMPQTAPGSETHRKNAASTSRQNAKAPQEDANTGPRRLMLRETDDQSVLASVRDAELSSSQSRLAADGLARALMEAGYARVQVVVNGQKHRNARNEAGTATTSHSTPNGQTQSTPTPSQERPHGR
ncbi:hypothetical protein ACS5PN_27990 [Roseateles sp. NT4]|uniref:hypothetical protein n=1 Tax=Roseateles sp. NT4 TaxID=3453715 RepID=UPI003EE966D9